MKVTFLIVFTFLLFINDNCIGQTNHPSVVLTKVILRNHKLKIVFQNNGDSTALVPELRYRIGANKNSLYARYFHFSADTIFINLSSYLNDGLYKVKYDARVKNGNVKLLYADKELRPSLTFATKVRIDSIRPAHILMLNFNDNYWIHDIN